jgi:uroporphyrinogen decarboxylase
MKGSMIKESPRQVIIDTVSFQRPARLARDLWVLPAAGKKFEKELNALQKKYPSDFAPDGFEDPAGGLRLYEPGTFIDPWGCGWENHTWGLLGQVRHFPLNDWNNLKHYHAPLHLIGRGFERVRETLAASSDKFHLGVIPSLFHRMCWLREPSLIFMDFYTNPEELKTLRDIVHDYNMRHLKELLKYRHECIFIGDDWGTQSQLFIRPEMWREYFKPCYEEYSSLARDAGKHIFFHSDGYIIDIVEDLLEIGVQALNCQVACMGVEELGRRFAGRLCFWGELDRQRLLPRGTPEEIIAAARKNLKNLSTPQGGYIMQAEVNADVPLENLVAVFQTYELAL